MSTINTKEDFKEVFDQYYLVLCHFLKKYTDETALIEDVVQDVFAKLWSNRQKVEIDNLKSYLFTSVKNRFLDYKKKENRQNIYLIEKKNQIETIKQSNDSFQDELILKQKIYNSLRHLPAKTREIFEMSKLKGLTYVEIANHKQISVKTVEAHISKAFNLIRENWEH